MSVLAKLVINPTSAGKKEIPIASRVISIGRDPSNDLVLSDSMVSRRHAILEQREDIYVLRDNNSSNGTLVNGDKVESEQTLRDGDLVAIGSSRLLFQLEEPGHKPEAADQAEPDAEPMEPKAPVVEAVPESAPSAPPVTAAPNVRVRCPACGKQALAKDRFCRACGSELERKTSVTCTACGQNVPLPAEFCGRCGHELPKRDREAPPTQPHRLSDLELDHADGGKSNQRASQGAGASVRGRPRSRPPGGPAEVGTDDESAGFGVRLVAWFVDVMILGIPPSMAALLWLALAGPRAVPQRTLLLGFLIFSLFCLVYYVFFWGARGATPGKSLLRLVVRTVDGDSPIGFGRAFLRVIGYLASLLMLGLGFAMIAFTADRRGLHDRIAGTRVTRNS